MKKKTIVIASALALLAAPAVAQAHVTLQPKQAPAGGFARLDVRVPNERDDASTTKVEIKFPLGFTMVSTEPVPGWIATVKKSKVAKPVEQDGEKVTEQVDTITWSGGKIGPGQFQDFGLSLGLPDKAGTSLTFKALQTYSNGEVVRWIGPPDAEQPAPQVELVAEGDAHAMSGGGATAAGITKPASVLADSNDGDSGDGAPTWLAVLALAIGALGLIAGVAGFTAARRASAG